jgi:hypothetical protein
VPDEYVLFSEHGAARDLSGRNRFLPFVAKPQSSDQHRGSEARGAVRLHDGFSRRNAL